MTEDVQIGGGADEKLQSQLYIGKDFSTMSFFYSLSIITVLLAFEFALVWL